MAGIQLFTLQNDVFRAYAFHAALLALKVFAIGALTGFTRIHLKVSHNPEDVVLFGKRAKLGQDPQVERVRRIHQNDLENVIPFWILALLYVATDPSPTVALTLFRLFTVSRITHSIVYYFAVAQPSRAITYGVGLLVNIYLLSSIILASF